jgi:hypothetical protein
MRNKGYRMLYNLEKYYFKRYSYFCDKILRQMKDATMSPQKHYNLFFENNF